MVVRWTGKDAFCSTADFGAQAQTTQSRRAGNDPAEGVWLCLCCLCCLLFMFRLTREEVEAIQCSRSQNVTLKRGQNVKYLPNAFTEHGALMAATVLNSPMAVRMSLFIIRAFVRMRENLAANAAILKRLAEID